MQDRSEIRRNGVKIWLWLGVVMIFIQVLLGGITRLTGSGLSITKWDIVTGAVPPLSSADWEKEFNLYKETPQYQHINQGMNLAKFKFIYFWEYVHRLWARSIGFVFLVPFLVFVSKGWISKRLAQDLGIAVSLGVIVAIFGWIMVASGLVERPWVNAYNLTVHLNLALVLYSWLIWVAIGPQRNPVVHSGLKKDLIFLAVFIALQLILGGLMSGMKAGLYYPTWPDMYGEFFPLALLDGSLWTSYFVFEAYERGPVPGVVQFLHRMTAYLIIGVGCCIYYKSIKYRLNKNIINKFFTLLVLILVQAGLGVLTVIHCKGQIPLFLGVAHQAGAMLLLSYLVFLHRKIER